MKERERERDTGEGGVTRRSMRAADRNGPRPRGDYKYGESIVDVIVADALSYFARNEQQGDGPT